MGKLIYNIGIQSYYLGIKIASLFNTKAKLWLAGRSEWRTRLREQVLALDPKRKIIWFHVSSLGEFEQGRPVMEALKKENDVNLAISFFSPSGYEVMKSWSEADLICYLPEDNAGNAADFVSILKPSIAVFVKYDLWYHFIAELKRKDIPQILISARFYKEQSYFKPWGAWYRKLLFMLDEILVQEQQSFDLLKSFSLEKVTITGDTRYDRVLALSKHKDRFPEIETFIEEKKVFIAGSTWPLDEKIMVDFLIEKPFDLRTIIAPHDVSEDHVNSLKKRLGRNTILYSELGKLKDENILIIDSVGMLSRIYRYGHISYVGGAFKEGLHNILEPAAYGLPVITGPDHSGFLEGPAMESAGALFRVKKRLDFEELITQMMTNEAFYSKASANAKSFIEKHGGACDKTVKIIERYLN
jgi:3-deoxy-D-manno-octulosonic-acid transferase